ncbi:MAG: protocatechuate 4,5-dioxygenase subunit alpha [Cohaesibacteraceae bacterium]|nr:protocatechuate 4,5-dioxygenase subunit alpha [Cohaesibacteraceae bacterium]MBL4876476.1 protocatechuate 4,5-dioxygenase subunit alpha [Cohaesibacteraceae bacterium]
MGLNDDYEDIPGTYVFNGRRCREGYHLNKFCKSLDVEANREAFRSDASAYMDQFPMTDHQRKTIEERDWLGMLKVGGNIYYTFKIAIFDRLSMQHVGGEMSGITVDEFRQMMLDGGRMPKNNTSKAENAKNG